MWGVVVRQPTISDGTARQSPGSQRSPTPFLELTIRQAADVVDMLDVFSLSQIPHEMWLAALGFLAVTIGASVASVVRLQRN
jgi:hypothetical protein